MKLIRGICVGSKACGKTTMLTHMEYRRLGGIVHATAGVDYNMFTHNETRFQCWDASGDSKYNKVVHIFARDCAFILYVFDITSQSSLNTAMRWRKELHDDNKMHILIANKKDKMQRARGISTALKQYPNMSYYEISATNLLDIEQMFHSIALNLDDLAEEDEDQASVPIRDCCTLC